MLSSERIDRCRARIDLGRETAIPGHDHSTVLVDLRNDATIAGTQAGVVTRGCDQLDSRTNRHTCADPCREKSCPLRVHTRGIGLKGAELYPSPRPWLQDSLTARRSRVRPADRSELDGLGSLRRHSDASR